MPCAGRLLMLVAQAKYAAELFLGRPMAEQRILEVYRSLLAEKGGPCAGGHAIVRKTGIGKALAKALKKALCGRRRRACAPCGQAHF